MKQRLPAGMADLLDDGAAPRISITLPTHPNEPTHQQDRTRYRNLIGAAEQQALANGYDKQLLAQALEPAYDLLENMPFWPHLNRGLAVYVEPHRQRTYRLPYPVAERGTVGTQFLITPLVHLLEEVQEFFILALSRGKVRLLRGTGEGLEEIPLPISVPTSLAAMLRDDEYETEHRYVAGISSARGRPGAIFYSHGSGGPELGVSLHRYCSLIDQGVRDIPGIEEAPLVLAGGEEILASYRQATSLPRVLAAANVGNPDFLSDAALHQHAWPLVEANLRQEQQRSLERYQALLGTGLASADPAEIVRAADTGRVDTLLLGAGKALWGTYNATAGTVLTRESRLPGDEDIANLAAVQTLRNGGTVRDVAHAQLLETVPFAAIFRY